MSRYSRLSHQIQQSRTNQKDPGLPNHPGSPFRHRSQRRGGDSERTTLLFHRTAHRDIEQSPTLYQAPRNASAIDTKREWMTIMRMAPT